MSATDTEAGIVPAGDAEWDAVACILATLPRFGPKLCRFMDAKRRRIDWDAVDASCYSHGEQLLVGLARNLWDGSECPGALELVATLDDDNFALALRAMRIRRDWRVALEEG